MTVNSFKGFLKKVVSVRSDRNIAKDAAAAKMPSASSALHDELGQHEEKAKKYWDKIHAAKSPKKQLMHHQKYTYHMDMARNLQDKISKITGRRVEIKDPRKR